MLPTTPSSPACIENVSGKDSLIKKPDENIDAENSSPLIEKATPRRGRPKKVVKLLWLWKIKTKFLVYVVHFASNPLFSVIS